MRSLGLVWILTCFVLSFATPVLNAADNNIETKEENLIKAKTLIEAQRFRAALNLLETIVFRDPTNADAQNLAGFAARNAGDLGEAAIYYARALALSPNHKGALEYQGQLYLLLDRPEKARANLDHLHSICGATCEEYIDLAYELAQYDAKS